MTDLDSSVDNGNESAPLSDGVQTQINEWIADKVGAVDDPPPPSIPEVEDTPEPAEEEPPAKLEKAERAGRAFAKVAERERQLRERQTELKALEDKIKPLQQAYDKLQSGDQLGALEDIGFSYEKATTQVLQGGKIGAKKMQSDLESRLEKLEKEKAELEQKQQAEQSRREVENYVKSVEDMVKKDDKYALTAARWEDAQEILLETQRQYAKTTGRLMSNEQALDLIEKYFEDTAIALASSPKVQARLGKKPRPEPQQAAERSESRRRTRSLRNAGASTTSAQTDKSRPTTKRDRLDAALAAYKQQIR